MAQSMEKKPTAAGSQQGLLAIVGVAMAGLVGWFVYTNYFAPPLSEEGGELSSTITLSQVDWSKDLFGSPAFQAFKNPLGESLVVGTKGNPKPFVEEQPKEATKK